MTSTIDVDHATLAVDRRVSTRLVQPGNWTCCVQCRQPISYQPGARRFLVVISNFENDTLQSVEQYHTECYVESG